MKRFKKRYGKKSFRRGKKSFRKSKKKNYGYLVARGGIRL